MRFPETRLPQNADERRFRAVKRAVKAPKKPLQPLRNIKAVPLRLLQHVVVGFPLRRDLRRHAVEALHALFRARQPYQGILSTKPHV